MFSETTYGTMLENAFWSFYSINDRGHQEEHFAAVESLALEMNREMNLGINPLLITAVAWTHDLFAWSRKNHHKLSALWVRTTDHPLIDTLTNEEREEIAIANECHRASYKGEFPTMLAELMSSADRGKPSDIRTDIMRGWEYSKVYLELNDHDGLLRSVSHLKEKYGRDGYARIPGIYKKYFQIQLEERYRQIDELQGKTFDEITKFLNMDDSINLK